MLIELLDSLRVLTPLSGSVRLLCAILFGGFIGIERGRKGRAAGFRTYVLVCMGAALTMMLGQYEYQIVTQAWTDTAASLEIKTDVSRFGAQVINGIGFLGAGTIIVTGHQKIKGVTTAAGLWACACMGLAIGAGFYEGMLFGFPLIVVCLRLLPFVENRITGHSRDMSVYIEFEGMERLEDIFFVVKEMNGSISDVELEHSQDGYYQLPSAVFCFHLQEKQSHAAVLTRLSRIEGVRLVDEV